MQKTAPGFDCLLSGRGPGHLPPYPWEYEIENCCRARSEVQNRCAQIG